MEKYKIVLGVSLLVLFILFVLIIGIKNHESQHSSPTDDKEKPLEYTISLIKFRDLVLENKSPNSIHFEDRKSLDEYIRLVETIYNFIVNNDHALSGILYDSFAIHLKIHKGERIEGNQYDITFDIHHFKKFILLFTDFLNTDKLDEEKYLTSFRVSRYHLLAGKGKHYINELRVVSLIRALKKAQILPKTFKKTDKASYTNSILNSIYSLGVRYVKLECS